MRSLKPNSKGIIVPTPVKFRTGQNLHAHRYPSQALKLIDRIMNGESPEICVSRSRGGIGDVLMTLPTVKAISKKYKCKIDYATDFQYLDGALPKVLIGNPYIRNVIPWRDIQKEKYNAIVDLTCPCVVHEKPLAPPINRIDLFARHAGVHLEDPSMDYIIQPEELKWAQKYLENNNLDRGRLLLVQPSSSSSHRDAPLDKMKRSVAQVLQQRKDVQAIVITHDSDNVKSDWRGLIRIHNLNNYDVRHIAAIMYYCDVVLCPDSSILHLASCLSKPTVTLFGPTDPHARVNYHPEAVAIWPGKELKNYPCWYEDPRDGYLCWKRLEEKDIIRCCLALLDNTPLPVSRDLVTYGNLNQENQLYEQL